MTITTVDRLDALPEFTLVEFIIPGLYEDGRASAYRVPADTVVSSKPMWKAPGSKHPVDSEWLLAIAKPGSIRVVSPPIEALLSEDVIVAVAGYRDSIKHQQEVRAIIRAAIAHVTGGAS